MSVSGFPPSGLTLRGIDQIDEDDPEQIRNPAIVFKLSDSLLEDVKKASSVQGGLQFITGHAPKIRLGKRTIDLTISPEAFRHELYSTSTKSLGNVDFAGLVSHRAELRILQRKQSIGTDVAVAALQSSLATHKQQKEAKSVNISNNVVAEPKNRWEAAREQKQARRRGLLAQYPASPSTEALSTMRRSAAPTSAPADDPTARLQAMKTPMVHLLAMNPLSKESIQEQTHIPKEDVEEILGRIGKQEQGKWQLTDRAYKELDVWKFGYSSQEDRQAAVDNAIRAYDRLRLGKDDKLWQKLLPENERDKGTVLSKLHLGAAIVNRNNTPNAAASPLPHGDGAGDGKAGSTTNTPRLGPASTPKIGGGKSGLSKRLFAKDPKKRAAEESKERKRKEREAAGTAGVGTGAGANSDREDAKAPARKNQTMRAHNPKVKSAEMVYSSSEESAGEIRDDSTNTRSSTSNKTAGGGGKAKVDAAANERKAATNASKAKAKHIDSASPNSSDAVPKPPRSKTTGAATPTTGTASSSRPTSAINSRISKAAALGKSTPTGLSAPVSQHRSQLSPQKPGTRPSVPSPLGPARPRVASDVSDKSAVGAQRAGPGAETPKGLGITNGFRKRHDTVTSNESLSFNNSESVNGDHPMPATNRPRQPAANGTATPKAALTNGAVHKEEHGRKRKSAGSPSQGHENGPIGKHRKTESSSSHSYKSSFGVASNAEHHLERSTSSDSVSSIINDITYPQGVNMAQKFRDVYYPQYVKLYDEQAAVEKRGEIVRREERQRLWEMHRRLEQMKREIRAASLREHLDE